MTSPTAGLHQQRQQHSMLAAATFAGHGFAPQPGDIMTSETQRAQTKVKRADGQTTGNVLSSSGFWFQNGSAENKEHKNSADTNISPDPTTEQKQSETNRALFRGYSTIQAANQLSEQHQGPPTFGTSALGRSPESEDQALLLPFVADSHNFHDSLIVSTSGVDTQQPGLSSRKAITNTPSLEEVYLQTSGDFVSPQQGHNMGYNGNNNTETSWGEASPKIETQHNRAAIMHGSIEHERKERDDDSATVRSGGSASLGSPSHGPFPGPPAASQSAVAGAQSTATTPSTVSTAPSTDGEGSFGVLDPNSVERLALRGEMLDQGNAQNHLRGQSWENPTYQGRLEAERGNYAPAQQPHPLPSAAIAAPSAWLNPQTNQRIASFRNDMAFPNAAPDQRWHQPHHLPHQHQQRFEGQPYAAARSREGRGYGPVQPSHYPYTGGHRPHSQFPPVTPPRSSRAPNRPSPAPSSGGHGQPPGPLSSSNPRSPSEVLKTLLRKKACLYEPDTSRAVALATWLVGRELALEFGYFSRQQLQAGVHACVSGKIDSGVITRTKVNRCMQIILNSCFHYIIPRPDGTEENGDAFRVSFGGEVSDDTRLLRELPPPWHDLSVDHRVVLEASSADLDVKQGKAGILSAPSTPQTSPRLGAIAAEKTSPKSKEDAENDSKRAVLLCFNENVRCAEDVFRCHNEFIRDTAHASGLQLSSSEWRLFFGKDAANSPYLWGNIGIPVPRSESSTQSDALGMMTHSELAKFRTSWCSKRYDHDHELCGFAHVEVNGGWLRRNILIHDYQAEMCPDIRTFASGRNQGSRKYVVNECPRGVNCTFAHSAEEILYHPRRYKGSLCSSLTRPGGCPSGDVCPGFHPIDSYKFPSKKGEGRLNSRLARQGAAAKGAAQPPSGAPILYCSPAPISRFEEQFQMPGLKNLYRRHCTVMRAHLRNPGSCVCCYSCFGDDNGTGVDPSKCGTLRKRGLPQPRAV